MASGQHTTSSRHHSRNFAIASLSYPVYSPNAPVQRRRLFRPASIVAAASLALTKTIAALLYGGGLRHARGADVAYNPA